MPTVIFEMTSPGTRKKDEEDKYALYEGMGVAEYWQFDPRAEWIEERLRGYKLVAGVYQPIHDGVSDALQLRLVPEGKLIGLYELTTGARLPIPEELRERWLLAQEQAKQASQRAEQEAQRAKQAEAKVAALQAKLRELGIAPDEG